MNVKEIFEKAQNGTLTYDQFMQLAGNSKFADLTEGNYVSKQKYEDDLASRDGRITDLNTTISKRDEDLASLQKKLDEAGNDANKLTEVSTQLANLQTKYDSDIKEYQAKIDKQNYEYAVKELANSKQFTSGAAKRDFIHNLIDKKLAMENGKLVGVDDFITDYQKENADAFVVDNNQSQQPNNNAPKFVDSTNKNNNNPDDGKSNPFGWNFSGVM